MLNYLTAIIFFLLSPIALSQNTIDTFFTTGELAALEELVGQASLSNPTVLIAKQNFASAKAELAVGNQLLDALTMNAGASLVGDFYGQSTPSYTFSLGVDVIKLIESTDRTQTMLMSVESARTKNRVEVVRAFTGWKVAIEQAKTASDFLESVGMTNQLVVHKLNVGDATQSDVTRAIADLSNAKIALLQANANVIVSLEALASVVGNEPRRTLDTINQIMLAHGEEPVTGLVMVAGN